METKGTTSPPFEVHILQDAAGQPKKRFTGKLLAHVSTGEHRSLPRWLTLDLYLKQDGTYILHRVGYSVVYHKRPQDGGCPGGELVTIDDLVEITDGDGEACPKCRPVPFKKIMETDESDPLFEEMVSLEHNYPKVIELASVSEIVKELEFVPKNSVKKIPTISRPGQELLLRAAALDPRIAGLDEVIQDI